MYDRWMPHCNTLQHTATHCNTLQHTRYVHVYDRVYVHTIYVCVSSYVCICTRSHTHKTLCIILLSYTHSLCLSPSHTHTLTYTHTQTQKTLCIILLIYTGDFEGIPVDAGQLMKLVEANKIPQVCRVSESLVYANWTVSYVYSHTLHTYNSPNSSRQTKHHRCV